MANAKECDVCGKLYENNKFDYDRIQGIRLIKAVGDVGRTVYDLCDDCCHKLLELLHDGGDSDGR